MWRGQYCDKEAAAKVLRLWTKDDLEQIKRVGISGALDLSCFQNLQRLIEILQGDCSVESSLSSKCAAAPGCDSNEEQFCDGIGVDGEW